MTTSHRRGRWVYGTLFTVLLALTGCTETSRKAEVSRGVPAATRTAAAPTATATPATRPPAPLKTGHLIRGKVKAPPGLLKPAPRRTSFLDGLLISPAYALSGLVEVGDVKVGVWEGDDLGRPIGTPLYTTYTNSYGDYEVILPPAYEPTPAVVVQVVDPYYPVRRLLTGLIGQDLTLVTEAAVSLLVDEARPVAVDVRVLPPQRVETVYVTVEQQIAPVAPIIVVRDEPREVGLKHALKRLRANLGPSSRPVVVVSDILARRDEFRPIVVSQPRPVDDVFVVYDDDDDWDGALIVRSNDDDDVRYVVERRIEGDELSRLVVDRGDGVRRSERFVIDDRDRGGRAVSSDGSKDRGEGSDRSRGLDVRRSAANDNDQRDRGERAARSDNDKGAGRSGDDRDRSQRLERKDRGSESRAKASSDRSRSDQRRVKSPGRSERSQAARSGSGGKSRTEARRSGGDRGGKSRTEARRSGGDRGGKSRTEARRSGGDRGGNSRTEARRSGGDRGGKSRSEARRSGGDRGGKSRSEAGRSGGGDRGGKSRSEAGRSGGDGGGGGGERGGGRGGKR